MTILDGAQRNRRINPEAAMSLVDHLRELRRRLTIGMVVIAAGAVVGWFLYDPVLRLLQEPYCSVGSSYRFGGANGRCVLIFTGVLDGFTVRLKLAVLVGAVITAPVWLYQIWAFVTPGLRRSERRYTVMFVTSSSLLFAAGSFLAYKILGRAMSMLLHQGGSHVQAMLTVNSYVSFVLLTLVVFGLSFELPLLVVMANRVGVLPAALLRRSQRIAIFLIFVFAGVAVPSTDPFSMCAMAVPMVVLYEAAVCIACIHDRRAVSKASAQRVLDDEEDLVPQPL